MMIYEQQILDLGEDVSTSSVGAFHASRSARRERERERRMTAISGQRCSELLTRYDPLGSLVRMLLVSSQWYSPVRSLEWRTKPLYSMRTKKILRQSSQSSSSKPSVETLSVSDIPSNRLLYQLVPLVRPTDETEYGLLPTPKASEASAGAELVSGRRKTRESGQRYSASIGDLAVSGLLPTPKAQEALGNASVDRGKFNLSDEVAKRCNLGGKSSQLNPLFVEEMMGFPERWTLLPFLVGDQSLSKPTEMP